MARTGNFTAYTNLGEVPEELLKKIHEIVENKVRARLEALVCALDLQYEVEPILEGFDPEATGWNAFNAACLLKIANLVYRPLNCLQSEMALYPTAKAVPFEDTSTSTEGFGITTDRFTILAFRGTNEIMDFIIDGMFFRKPFAEGKVHSGFLKSANSVRNSVHFLIRSHSSQPRWRDLHYATSSCGECARFAVQNFSPFRLQATPRQVAFSFRRRSLSYDGTRRSNKSGSPRGITGTGRKARKMFFFGKGHGN